MQGCPFTIRRFESRDTEAVTSFWRESMQLAIGIPPVHSFASQAYFLEHILPTDCYILVAATSDSDQPVAFLAANESTVEQLYIHNDFQRCGIGSQLLNLAKERSSGSLELRTFAVNLPARLFYESHGFSAIGGDSDNEEGLPDILYHWQQTE